MGEAIEQALREATASLAQCYRLSGADPDGDSDSMLAKFAVEEVGRLRREHDEMADRIVDVIEELDRRAETGDGANSIGYREAAQLLRGETSA